MYQPEQIIPHFKKDTPPGLTLLLDTLDAVEPEWELLSEPTPLFLREVRAILIQHLGPPTDEPL